MPSIFTLPKRAKEGHHARLGKCAVHSARYRAVITYPGLGTDEKKGTAFRDSKRGTREAVQALLCPLEALLLYSQAILTVLCRGQVVISIKPPNSLSSAPEPGGSLIMSLTSTSSRTCFVQCASLPPEIVRMIVLGLSRRDLFSARYLNKTFAAISAVRQFSSCQYIETLR